MKKKAKSVIMVIASGKANTTFTIMEYLPARAGLANADGDESTDRAQQAQRTTTAPSLTVRNCTGISKPTRDDRQAFGEGVVDFYSYRRQERITGSWTAWSMVKLNPFTWRSCGRYTGRTWQEGIYYFTDS